MILTLAGWLYSLRVLKRKSTHIYELNFKSIKIDEESIIFFIGMIAFVGTILVGVITSKLIRPLFMLRYFIPAGVLIYYLSAISISKLKNKTLIGLCLSLIIIATMGLSSFRIIKKEYIYSEKTEYGISVIEHELGDNTIILTNDIMLHWTVLNYHFENTENRLVDNNTVNNFALSENNKYLVIWNEELPNSIITFLSKKGYNVKKIADKNNVSIGMSYFNVYSLELQY